MFAQQRVGSSTLRTPGGSGHELVTSCEPCAMCLGATLWSGVSRLVIGAERADAMSVGFEEGPVFAESYAYIAKRGVETVRGIRRTKPRACYTPIAIGAALSAIPTQGAEGPGPVSRRRIASAVSMARERLEISNGLVT